MRTASTTRAAIGALTFAVAATGFASAQPAPGPGGAGDNELTRFARQHVFKIESKVGDGTEVGSGVFLEVTDGGATGRRPEATLVTVYHVLQGSEWLVVRDHLGRKVAESSGDTPVYADRQRELALVRLRLDPEEGVELRPTPLTPQVEIPEGVRGMRVALAGRAFGYPADPVDRVHRLTDAPVSFQGIALARVLGIVSGSDRPDDSDRGGLSPGSMGFRILGGDPTREGMSGGLLVDRTLRFGGLVYGRRTDQYNLGVPAEAVAISWREAGDPQNAGRWKPLSQGPFRAKGLFGSQGTDRDRRFQELWAANQKLQGILDDMRLLNSLSGLRGVAMRIEPSSRVPAAATEVKQRYDFIIQADTSDLPEATRRELARAKALLAAASGDYAAVERGIDLDQVEQEAREGKRKWMGAVSQARLRGQASYSLKHWAEAARAYQMVIESPFAETLDAVGYSYCRYQLDAPGREGTLALLDEFLRPLARLPEGTPMKDSLAIGMVLLLRAEIFEDRKSEERAAEDWGRASCLFAKFLDDGSIATDFSLATAHQLEIGTAQMLWYRASDYHSLGKFEEAIHALDEAVKRLRRLLPESEKLEKFEQNVKRLPQILDKWEEMTRKLNELAGLPNKPGGNLSKEREEVLASTEKLRRLMTRTEDGKPASPNKVAQELASMLNIRAMYTERYNLEFARTNRRGEITAWKQRMSRVEGDLDESARLYLSAENRDEAKKVYGRLAGFLEDHARDYYKAGFFKESGDTWLNQLQVINVLLKQFEDNSVLSDCRVATMRLAWLKATCPDERVRNGEHALQLAQLAVREMRVKNFDGLRVLAAAEAEVGRFDAAIKHQDQAIELAPEKDRADLRKDLETYRQNKPVRYDPRQAKP